MIKGLNRIFWPLDSSPAIHKFPRSFHNLNEFVFRLCCYWIHLRNNKQPAHETLKWQLINNFSLSFFSQQTNSRWRAIRWFQMPTFTSGGSVSCVPGSTSQPASTADVRIASRRPRPCSRVQLPVLWSPSCDARRSVITQSCVRVADSHWLSWRWVVDRPAVFVVQLLKILCF